MFELVFDGPNLFHQKLLIHGPADTPYAGGVFEVDLVSCIFFGFDHVFVFKFFDDKYPKFPPTVRMMTPIYHLNFDGMGFFSFVCCILFFREYLFGLFAVSLLNMERFERRKKSRYI
jgi:hypothetical protein